MVYLKICYRKKIPFVCPVMVDNVITQSMINKSTGA